jgi:hypothetical protein
MIPLKRSPGVHRAWLAALTTTALAVVLSACATHPAVRTESAPEANLLRYQTFGYVEHPDTDKRSYTTLTTRYLKDAINREMLARGYTQSDRPDLVINFTVASKDRIESYPYAGGVGFGRWGRGFGGGGWYGGSDIRTVTDGSLTIDVVDPGQRQLVWRGVAEGRLTQKALKEPQPAIDQAVDAIFAKYPKQPLVALTSPK